MRKFLLSLIPALAVLSCSSKAAEANNNQDAMNSDSISGATAAASTDTNAVKVQLTTSEGDITLLLYSDTPKHRDNFVKLVNEGFYDGVLFHRVINDFMIQPGDPDSKNAPAGKQLGSGGPGYEIDAEFIYPKHFHKRGALSAARTGDQVNPERKSSGSQFYIVTGKKYTQSELQQLQQQMQQGAIQSKFYELAGKRRADIERMQKEGDQAGLAALQQELVAQAQKEAEAASSFTDQQVKAYTTEGGTPFLDGQYTVFGEVLSGMDVVDKIQKVKTDRNDRPIEDVKILSAKILD
jgi:cyclophilin family peptidyl-prolyl cis-trans isomerase